VFQVGQDVVNPRSRDITSLGDVDSREWSVFQYREVTHRLILAETDPLESTPNGLFIVHRKYRLRFDVFGVP